jgi:hypothetical protein
LRYASLCEERVLRRAQTYSDTTSGWTARFDKTLTRMIKCAFTNFAAKRTQSPTQAAKRRKAGSSAVIAVAV